MSTINERIGKILSCTGMTKTAFAERLSVSQQYISKVVKSGNPSDMLIAAICHEFNVSEHWLRTGEGEMVKVDGRWYGKHAIEQWKKHQTEVAAAPATPAAPEAPKPAQ